MIGGREYDAWRLVPEANGYRLPTEAEWEYACLAGTSEERNIETDGHAPPDSNTIRVTGAKHPSGWGLFDMYGNVWEWSQDWDGPFPSDATLVDPQGASEGMDRVLRAGMPSSAARRVSHPNTRDTLVGFRIARTIP